jgi:predicted chitinase
VTSPFKFLDAYDRSDGNIFFGRTEEIDQLYTSIFQTNLLLVYGESGTGKTSLIQCGLANRFRPTDWFELFVRRKDDINVSLDREIRRSAHTPIGDDAGVPEAIQSLYLDYLRPVYLIFDQFEELFILGSTEEQQRFFHTIASLLTYDVPCKSIFVMREEYLARLHDFEKQVPTLFNKRFRVGPMSHRNLQRVISGTATAFGIVLEEGDRTALQIIDSLSDNRVGVQLSYLQVYLDKLYRKATAGLSGDGEPGKPVVFTPLLVQQTGALGDVMADFLEEQTGTIQQDLEHKYRQIGPTLVQLVLEEFATLEGTKQQATPEDVSARMSSPPDTITDCISSLEKARILRNADGAFELAHDSLAGVIADRRSIERKHLLRVQKLVKDRLAVFAETHSYLSKEELAYCTPSMGQMHLTDQERTFVRKSERTVRRKERRQLVLIFSSIVSLIVLLAVIYNMKTSQEYARQLERYSLMLRDANAEIVQKEQAASAARRSADTKLRELHDYFTNDVNALPNSDSSFKRRTRERLQNYGPDATDWTTPISFSGDSMEDRTLSDAVIVQGHTYALAQLQAIMPRASEPDLRKFIFAFNKSAFAKSINTPRRFAAYLAVVSVLSDQLTSMEISYDYTTAELKARYPNVFRNVDPDTYAGNPEKTANRIFAGQYGNGGDSSGDGWRYRGRGIFKIWFKERYREYAVLSGYDLVSHPEWMTDVDVATSISCIIWVQTLGHDPSVNMYADENDFASIADRIVPFVDKQEIPHPREKLTTSYAACCRVLHIE